MLECIKNVKRINLDETYHGEYHYSQSDISFLIDNIRNALLKTIDKIFESHQLDSHMNIKCDTFGKDTVSIKMNRSDRLHDFYDFDATIVYHVDVETKKNNLFTPIKEYLAIKWNIPGQEDPVGGLPFNCFIEILIQFCGAFLSTSRNNIDDNIKFQINWADKMTCGMFNSSGIAYDIISQTTDYTTCILINKTGNAAVVYSIPTTSTTHYSTNLVLEALSNNILNTRQIDHMEVSGDKCIITMTNGESLETNI